MTKDEALKLALDAFGEIEWSNNSQWQSDRAKVAITAIKTALEAEDEQLREENERLHVENRRLIDRIETIGVPVGVGGFATTTSQRTWVGLTDDDKVLIKHDANFNQFMTAGEYADRVQQLTEARLKDKNT